jgi:ribonuclease I
MRIIYLIPYLLLIATSYTPECPEYTVLAIQRCNESIPYSIHGLWPEYNTTNCTPSSPYPSFCEPVEFNESMIDHIRNDLEAVWYSCYGPAFSFWEHEVRKHYSCIEHKHGVVKYMQDAIDIFKNVVFDLPDFCKDKMSCIVNF